MKLIGQGRTADILEYSEDKIIKLYQKDFSVDAINHEFQVSQFVSTLGLNTPRVFGLIDFDNRQGIVLQRLEGVTLLRVMAKKPWLINNHAKLFANTHFKIHTNLASLELRNQKSVLNRSIQATELLTEEEKNKIIHYLVQLPNGDRLCHGDFHPDNVMIGEHQSIIDWMTGMCGNPAGDVARTMLLLDHGTMPEGTPKVRNAFINMLRKRIRMQYMKSYLSLSELTYSDVDRWILPVAAARLVEWIPKSEKDDLLRIVKDRLRAIT